MYLTDVEEGGETVFPAAEHPGGAEFKSYDEVSYCMYEWMEARKLR